MSLLTSNKKPRPRLLDRRDVPCNSQFTSRFRRRLHGFFVRFRYVITALHNIHYQTMRFTIYGILISPP